MRRKDEPDDTGDILGSEAFERTKSMLEGWEQDGRMGAVTELSIVVILGLLVTFGSEDFRKGSAALLTEGIKFSVFFDTDSNNT